MVSVHSLCRDQGEGISMLLLEELWEPTLTGAGFGYSFQNWASAMVDLFPWGWAWMTVLSALGVTERRLCGLTLCNTLISALCLSYQSGRQVKIMVSSEAPFANFTVTAREKLSLSPRCSRVTGSGQKALRHFQQLNGWAVLLFNTSSPNLPVSNSNCFPETSPEELQL